ncbi:histidine phosphatase family protein [Salinarchaeum sp. IM2453]|uniref:histidine phosphatase family protein n=1 Tax=Salinarchaeum sp. IM2453 TaxID=2862870 RepID=UPI001C82D8DF|nr:histidine phosphatase family protein [Salinarchaeum sp. IM2453]QZA87892.1 histidine phosphatase family protein [Salinarchaeum sp. IM2453]
MPQFYLTRHGQTDWNRDNRIQGWAYTSINNTGQNQAHTLRKHLQQLSATPDTIYSSDLPRARETTNILTEQGTLGNTSVTYHSDLRERNFGVYQGFNSDGFFERYPQYSIFDNGDLAAEKVPENGESYASFDTRVQHVWTDICERHSDTDKTILIVTHGGVITLIVGKILGYNYETSIKQIDISNCSLTKIVDTGTQKDIDYVSKDSFLS